MSERAAGTNSKNSIASSENTGSDQNLPANLLAILSLIEDDTTHGANDLALICMQKLASAMRAESSHSLRNWLTLIDMLAECRTSMVSFANLMQELKQEMVGKSPEEFALQGQSVINATYVRFADATEQMTAHAAGLLSEGSTVMTISRSSSILAALRKAKNKGINFDVIQLASGPANEGYLMAADLNQLQIATLVITDAQAGLFAGQADLVMVGCDSWLADQHFINKVGTYPLALIAKAKSIPLWVLADRYKNCEYSRGSVVLEEMSRTELDAPSGDFIRVRNIYFEPVPLALVSGRVDESGCHSFNHKPLHC